ncbi:CCA tRNA nucleotidyltransferase [Kineothrix sp. MB12-C1]|uniref:CCA tRNA nucleotidyltransferase n=1 Tax=Kineothrix sp. MB12-C1 TaxID=3070215 RepID=UPI0027D3516A|nr:CCA tRNA nucleotidyltransferase [Kineothrix sp. MB12-C1]WMC91199.1 CCA tRNA nucleotidyltransferase [Kineothrix sp. MB12-C1]
MIIELPEKVKEIITVIENAGYEAYAVGGCVRDSLLRRLPDDWDITTSAKPEKIKELFRRTVDTGLQHGTITVLMDKESFEVTTYRIDGEYEDSRHPKEVTFTSDIEEDLRRRDFTINAMAYNDRYGLVDVFSGMEDIERGLIRCVGDPRERFTEDALRMMRAVRFSAQLGYAIDDDTKKAIEEMAENLIHISAERIRTELIKLLVSEHPDDLRTCYETGITKIVLPEFDRCMETEQNNPHHSYSVGEHTLYSMKMVEADKVLRLAMLFHDMGKPETRTTDSDGIDHFYRHVPASERITKEVLHRLKFDNDTMDKVVKLVRYHDYDIPVSPREVRRAINKMGEDIFPGYIAVKRADILAQSSYKRDEKLNHLTLLEGIYTDVRMAGECVCLKTLAVTGRDLIEAGMKPGKELGEVLNQLLEAVLEEPELNTKEKLLEYAVTMRLIG